LTAHIRIRIFSIPNLLLSGDSEMRHVDEVIDEFDVTETGGQKKVQIVKWFQKHPGKRFDTAEITDELGDELEIGRGMIQNYLQELVDEDVLQRRGEKRIGYQLADDIMIPARYRVQAVLRHLAAVFDTERWGIAGILTTATALWGILNLPFWFLWGTLLIFPRNSYGSITRSEFLTMAISMSLWLVLFVVASAILYRGHHWYQNLST
jgi:hypothetical protein